jgi:hypothetical protein
MKAFLLLLLAASSALGAAMTQPIKNGVLQSPLNGNTYAITNVGFFQGKLDGTNVVNGQNITNLATTNLVGEVTNVINTSSINAGAISSGGVTSALLHATGGFVGNGIDITNIDVATSFDSLGRRYNLKSNFGAVGDGKCITNCVATAGTNWVIAESGNPWAAADVGKAITIYQAKDNIHNISGTITEWQANGILIDTNAGYSVTANAMWGTDDRDAIQMAVNVVATNGGGTIVCPPGIYVIAGALQDYGASSTHHRAQIIVPPAACGTNGTFAGPEKPVLYFEGAVPVTPGGTDGTEGTKVNNIGAVFWTTLPDGANGNSGASQSGPYYFGQDKVLDMRNFNGTFLAGIANALTIRMKNLVWRAPYDANIIVLDLRGAANMQLEDVLIDGGYIANGTMVMASRMTGTNGFGLFGPTSWNGNQSTINRVMINCFYNGFHASGFGAYTDLLIEWCYNGVCLFEGAQFGNYFYGYGSACNARSFCLGDKTTHINASVNGDWEAIADATWITEDDIRLIYDPLHSAHGNIWYQGQYHYQRGQIPGSMPSECGPYMQIYHEPPPSARNWPGTIDQPLLLAANRTYVGCDIGPASRATNGIVTANTTKEWELALNTYTATDPGWCSLLHAYSNDQLPDSGYLSVGGGARNSVSTVEFDTTALKMWFDSTGLRGATVAAPNTPLWRINAAGVFYGSGAGLTNIGWASMDQGAGGVSNALWAATNYIGTGSASAAWVTNWLKVGDAAKATTLEQNGVADPTSAYVILQASNLQWTYPLSTVNGCRTNVTVFIFGVTNTPSAIGYDLNFSKYTVNASGSIGNLSVNNIGGTTATGVSVFAVAATNTSGTAWADRLSFQGGVYANFITNNSGGSSSAETNAALRVLGGYVFGW